MPPKQAKSGGRGKGEETKEDPLQAVVVADTFEIKFAPFSTERPRCLIPLANTPLIEYTLEFLASGGVQEVILYAGAHIEQVETYLNASKWMSSASPSLSARLEIFIAAGKFAKLRDLDCNFGFDLDLDLDLVSMTTPRLDYGHHTRRIR